MIGSTSESLTNIGEKAIESAPITKIKNGLILNLGKNFFRLFFFNYRKMNYGRK
jgi:hypothetical protein